MILDIHTHHAAPQPCGVISLSPSQLPAVEGTQLYSVGIHPWETAGDTSAEEALLPSAAARGDVAAIGETGIDLTRGAPLFEQMLLFRRHVELSEKLRKPLIIHDVKAHDIITGLRRELRPAMPWIVHGFRGKPQLAVMLLRAGIMLSYGERFNEAALAVTPPDMLLAETDCSESGIESVIAKLERAAGRPLRAAIAANTARLLSAER